MSVRVEARGAAVVLTIDRPSAKNALSAEVARELAEAVTHASTNPGVRGVVLTGGGTDTFVSGGDLKELGRLLEARADAGHVLDMQAPLDTLGQCEVPIVAAVQGDVLGGGCELLLHCDLVVIEQHARLSFRHAKMGLSPAWGGVTRLLERVGALEAARLLLTAEPIDADEARRLGLANEVVPQGASRARALALIERIADNPRASVAALKRALRETREAMRGDALARERAIFAQRWGGEDHLAAMHAFRTRR